MDITARAHALILPSPFPGAMALDATVGSGADALFLARNVGLRGRVHAFDVQGVALDQARHLLAAAGVDDRVYGYLRRHSSLSDHVPQRRFNAAMFNLGRLPGSDRRIVTRPGSTVSALAATPSRLAPGGRLTVIVYRGHAGGPAEATAVEQWIRAGAGGLRLLLTEPEAPWNSRAPLLHLPGATS